MSEPVAEQTIRESLGPGGGFSGINVNEYQGTVKRLEEKATIDELTRLLRREPWFLEGKQFFEHSKRENEELSVIYVDINDFKPYNDTYGHAFGDEIIKVVANSIKTSVRKSDFAGRVGGDEMAICLPNTSLAETNKLAERIKEQILTLSKSKKDFIEKNIVPSVTFGISRIHGQKSFEDLVKEADENMLKLKKEKGYGR